MSNFFTLYDIFIFFTTSNDVQSKSLSTKRVWPLLYLSKKLIRFGLGFFQQSKRFILVMNKCMKRYLILLFLFLNNIVLSQDSKYLSLNLVDKIDIGSSFEITDNQVGDIIKKNLQSQGFNFLIQKQNILYLFLLDGNIKDLLNLKSIILKEI